MNCSKCGKHTDRSYAGMCQSCYRYYHEGGVDNPLPKLGKVEHDYRGYVVCHICGRAFKRLGSHIKESHDMNIAEYKAKFELCNNARTTEKNYSQHMHKLAYKYDMPNRLQETGKATRIKKGDTTMRKNKPVRLQEIIDKRNRGKTNEQRY